MRKSKLSRRGFFRAGLAGAAVGIPGRSVESRANVGSYGDYLKQADPGQETLAATESDIEGPFFRANAPLRSRLHQKDEKGEFLVVSGAVKARNGRPLREALLEVWQADGRGRYDNDDPARPPRKDEFRLRVRLRTDEKGSYRFETIKPGAYRIGPNRFRPAHIHVKVHCKGYRSLTTQLYFEKDPHNKKDPWFKKNRTVKFEKGEGAKVSRGTFTFVLPRA